MLPGQPADGGMPASLSRMCGHLPELRTGNGTRLSFRKQVVRPVCRDLRGLRRRMRQIQRADVQGLCAGLPPLRRGMPDNDSLREPEATDPRQPSGTVLALSREQSLGRSCLSGRGRWRTGAGGQGGECDPGAVWHSPVMEGLRGTWAGRPRLTHGYGTRRFQDGISRAGSARAGIRRRRLFSSAPLLFPPGSSPRGSRSSEAVPYPSVGGCGKARKSGGEGSA